MIIDMHCHTAEGSPDGMVPVADVIEKLKEKGYNGMVVTDHNSYKGYNNIKESIKDFIVLKGVEYDTRDAGHMLIILPSHIDYEIFTLRGMKLEDTINIVHVLGGIIGPAHPFDYYKMGMCNNPMWISKFEAYNKLDFIETFNACGREMGNVLADKLADFIDKPKVGGSDSHRLNSIGMGYTKFNEDIQNEDDLIRIIKSGNSKTTEVGGDIFHSAMINKHKVLFGIGARTYTLFNSYIAKRHEKKSIILTEIFGVR